MEVEEFLEHHGIKGQKWGIRRLRRAELFKRASKPNSGIAKTRAITGGLGPIDLIKGRGISGGSDRKFKRISSRETRIRNGKSHISDKIIHYGSTRIEDLVPVKNPKDKVGLGGKNRDKIALAVAGTLFISNFLARSVIKNA